MGEVAEKCAVTAFVGADTGLPASALAYESLFAMQHRGSEASGIATLLPGTQELESHRAPGMVNTVYDIEDIRRLAGSIAIGHNRYSTQGAKDRHMQPFEDVPIGFAFGHNGNLPVTSFLERQLSLNNIQTRRYNDSEMMGLAIAQNIRSGHDLPEAIELAYPLFRGAFSCVAMHDGMVVAFRDSKGIRPLALGQLEGGYTVSSETCGLDIVDATYQREVQPGELVVVTKDGFESRQISEGEEKLDMFEFVYFARHDSQLYGQRVNEVRRRFGEQLAEQHPPTTNDLENVLVVPIPDTSVPAAEGYAKRLGIEHSQAVIKNRYIGRTFMQPSHGQRTDQLRRKHNMIPEQINGRDIIFVDDSIVRLNTMPRIVQLAYECGAKSVNVLVASPPVRFSDFYGIDTPEQEELAAFYMTIDQIRDRIGCNYLGYLSLGRMVEATGLPAERFNLSCFTGEYPVGIGHLKGLVKTPVSMDCAT